MRLAVVFGKFTYEDSNQKEFLIFIIEDFLSNNQF